MDAGTESIMDESREIQNAHQASAWRLLAERASKDRSGEADKPWLRAEPRVGGAATETLHVRFKTLMRVDHDCRRSTGWRPSWANALRPEERILCSIAILICLFPAELRPQPSRDTDASPFSFL